MNRLFKIIAVIKINKEGRINPVKTGMTLENYQNLLNQVEVYQFNSWPQIK